MAPLTLYRRSFDVNPTNTNDEQVRKIMGLDRPDRKAAEHAYTMTAFNYEANPVGSRDWSLFWNGWQAALSQPASEPAEFQAVGGASNDGDLTIAYMAGVYDERARKRKAPCAEISGIVAEMRHHYPHDNRVLTWAAELEQIDPLGDRLQSAVLRRRVSDAVRNWRSGLDDAQAALSQIDVALQARGNPEWPTEARIDTIAQNGNDGAHYGETGRGT